MIYIYIYYVYVIFIYECRFSEISDAGLMPAQVCNLYLT